MLEDVVHKLPADFARAGQPPKMQPIGVRDPVTLVRQVLIDGGPGGCHDVGTHEVMSYKELMVKAAEQLNKRPFFSPFSNRQPGPCLASE